MPMTLDGSCRCGAIRFQCQSHTPVPYQRCYCSICRKTAGGGGYAINLGACTEGFVVEDRDDRIGVYRAEIRDAETGACRVSSGHRHFCTSCAAALWLFSPEWPELIHPFASAIDSELPAPPSHVHAMLRFKPAWVDPHVTAQDDCFELYPSESLEQWHRGRGLWVD